jgi:hypothetical protein
MIRFGEDVPLDVCLLTFEESADFNRAAALRIIESELATCLYLERFEFI